MAGQRNIYDDVTSITDVRDINREIRHLIREANSQDEIEELKKRSDIICALTQAPSWRERFGRKTSKFLRVAREEDERTTRVANSVARRRGFGADYRPWRGEPPLV